MNNIVELLSSISEALNKISEVNLIHSEQITFLLKELKTVKEEVEKLKK